MRPFTRPFNGSVIVGGFRLLIGGVRLLDAGNFVDGGDADAAGNSATRAVANPVHGLDVVYFIGDWRSGYSDGHLVAGRRSAHGRHEAVPAAAV